MPDGDKIVTYSSSPFRSWIVALTGTEAELLSDEALIMLTPTADGTSFVGTRFADTGFTANLVTLDVTTPEAESELFLDRPGLQWWPTLSPDGRYVAYTSSESGEEQIYVTTFPTAGPRWRVSQGFGGCPRWSGDGSELFWTDRQFMYSCTVEYGADTIEFGAPTALFERRLINWDSRYVDGFDVSADGQRFVVVEPSSDSGITPRELAIVQSWTREFE